MPCFPHCFTKTCLPNSFRMSCFPHSFRMLCSPHYICKPMVSREVVQGTLQLWFWKWMTYCVNLSRFTNSVWIAWIPIFKDDRFLLCLAFVKRLFNFCRSSKEFYRSYDISQTLLNSFSSLKPQTKSPTKRKLKTFNEAYWNETLVGSSVQNAQNFAEKSRGIAFVLPVNDDRRTKKRKQ